MSVPLPAEWGSLFWDCDPRLLDLWAHRSFVIRRVLDRGGLDAMHWLRRQYGDEALRTWFRAKQGGGLSPRTLRFWSLILDLPQQEADEWVCKARKNRWHSRAAR